MGCLKSKAVGEVPSLACCKCGRQLSADALFCDRCGSRQQEDGSTQHVSSDELDEGDGGHLRSHGPYAFIEDTLGLGVPLRDQDGWCLPVSPAVWAELSLHDRSMVGLHCVFKESVLLSAPTSCSRCKTSLHDLPEQGYMCVGCGCIACSSCCDYSPCQGDWYCQMLKAQRARNCARCQEEVHGTCWQDGVGNVYHWGCRQLDDGSEHCRLAASSPSRPLSLQDLANLSDAESQDLLELVHRGHCAFQEIVTLKVPSWCSSCGSFLAGFAGQGRQCCGRIVCHDPHCRAPQEGSPSCTMASDTALKNLVLEALEESALSPGKGSWISGLNFSQGNISGAEWLYTSCTYLRKISCPEPGQLRLKLEMEPVKFTALPNDLWIEGYTRFGHYFYHTVDPSLLKDRDLGLKHAFMVLHLNIAGIHICMEKWADTMVASIGKGDIFIAVARVCGRPGGCRPVRKESPVMEGPRVHLQRPVPLGNILHWFTVMSWVPYTLVGGNCQTFARSLEDVLCGRVDCDQSIAAIVDDKILASGAMTFDGQNLQFASDRLRADPEVVLKAVQSDWTSLRYAHTDMRGRRDIILEGVLQSGRCLEYASEHVRADREIVFEAYHQDPAFLCFADESLQIEVNMLDACREAGERLKVPGTVQSLFISSGNASYSTINASAWQARVVWSLAHIQERRGNHFAVDFAISDYGTPGIREHIVHKCHDRKVDGFASYKHVFPKRRHLDSATQDQLDDSNLGLYHAFVILTLDDKETLMCIEKFNDKIEVMIGKGQWFELCAKMFRATGQERDGDWRPDEQRHYNHRPIQRVTEVMLQVPRPVQDLWPWLEEQTQIDYSLVGKNCQDFADALRRFLKGEVRPAKEDSATSSILAVLGSSS